jgi:hypothetical protein
MVKDAVSSALAHTKEKYEKILQEKLAGLFFFPFETICSVRNSLSFFVRTISTICAIQ